MLKLLYLFFIAPIEYILDCLFYITYTLSGENVMLSLINLSIVVSVMALPVYLYADRLAEKQKQKDEEMHTWIAHIKRVYKGDEKQMMISRYYRLQGFHPVQSLRGSLSILFQIPFFMAAYHFISNLEVLNKCALGPIHNLGTPDGLLAVGNLSINVLPFIMTLINLLSVIVYTPKGRGKDLIQPSVLALFFLIILYNSPSGLVLYWIFNNAFSLIKNIVIMVKRKVGRRGVTEELKSDSTADKIGVYSALGLWLLMGGWIPLTVISSSPKDFADVYAYKSPLWYMIYTACVYGGLFIFWGSIIYKAISYKSRKIMGTIMCSLLFHNVLMFFTVKKDGVYTAELTLDNGTINVFEKDPTGLMYGLLAVPVIVALVVYLNQEHKKILLMIQKIIVVSLLFLMVLSSVKTVMTLSQIKVVHTAAQAEKNGEGIYNGVEKELRLSRTGKNVVVIMLDRGLGYLIPYMLEEKPELMSKMDGFVWYSNCLSPALHTNLGAPGIFGGYEYTPEGMLKDEDRPVSEKMNEALAVMPLMFSREGFSVDVCDLPNAGFDELSDMSFMEEIEGVEAHKLIGKYSSVYSSDLRGCDVIRSFVFYSVMNSMSIWLREAVYDNGNYLASSQLGGSIRAGSGFMNNYSALAMLGRITGITEDEKGVLLLMDNELPHENTILQLPDYIPVNAADNTAFYEHDGIRVINGKELLLDDEFRIESYHVNMASLLLIADWCDHLKKEGIYDNTRIIIVSDHAYELGLMLDFTGENGLNIEGFQALLMMKDFNASGFKEDNTFMSNADVPALAIYGVLSDYHNPFTGNIVGMEGKSKGVMATNSHNYTLDGKKLGAAGYAFDISDGKQYRVSENAYDPECWDEIME